MNASLRIRAFASRERLTLVWALLLTLTLVSFRVGRVASGATLLMPVLGLAMLKGQLVVDHFMGLRRVRRGWRLLMTGYLLSVGALIWVAYSIA